MVNKVNDSLTLINRGNDLITIQTQDNIRTVSILVGNDKVNIIQFKDTIISLNEDNFIRTMNSGMVIHYKHGKQVKLVHKIRSSVYIDTIQKDSEYRFNAITMVLETRTFKNGTTRTLKDGTIEDISITEVVSAAIYDGIEYQTYFLTDYPSTHELLNELITDLLSNPRYNGRDVYLHNFSGGMGQPALDGNFLIKKLALYASNFDIIMKDGDVIKLDITKDHIFQDQKLRIKVTFKESHSYYYPLLLKN